MRIVIASLMVVAGLVGTAVANPLAQFVDQTWVLVVSSPSADSDGLRRQDRDLQAHRGENAARDIVVVSVVDSKVSGPQLDEATAAEIRHALGLHSDRFEVALVGKDGA